MFNAQKIVLRLEGPYLRNFQCTSFPCYSLTNVIELNGGVCRIDDIVIINIAENLLQDFSWEPHHTGGRGGEDGAGVFVNNDHLEEMLCWQVSQIPFDSL